MNGKGEVLISLRDVRLRLGGHPILDGVSLEIRDRVRPHQLTGQIVGLLGPSGVGKTRLLRIIAGLDPPDSGVVLGPGGKPLDVQQVGVVFQNYPLLRHRTVLANLEVASRIAGSTASAARQTGLEMLARFGLANHANHYPAQLSGGQRQRVAIAQQLVSKKTFLLLDEPFSGLDPVAMAAVIRLLVEVANMAEHNTLFVITHDLWAAMIVCDTLFMLGRPEKTGGAKITARYDLVERGLAWRSDVEEDPRFAVLEREIRAGFRSP